MSTSDPVRRRSGMAVARLAALLLSGLLAIFPALALDLDALWDFGNPALSEQRFTAALADASADQRLILQTQIARTFGLRRDFDKARAVLATIEPEMRGASLEAQVRYQFELGRSFFSAAHPPAERGAANLDRARAAYLRAHELAVAAQLDGLAVDALHMLAIVESEPERQLEWNERAVALIERSDQPAAKRWEGALRNNIGHVKRQNGDYDAALAEFRLSRAAYQRAGRTRNVRIADWMIARTYRDQRRFDEALALQLELERAWDADGRPDPHVFAELEHIYRALGDEERALFYRAKANAATR
ncbi:tetratricopeptide repeat protein [Piscinibacter sakaiensis]|uniref:tetratricopeptide repeat protein n=1 Tax=Piscinibacter sakaiensis TaxID=1547922 RepID=UPI003AAE1016